MINKIILILTIINLRATTTCMSQDCANLPSHFSTYSEATTKILNSKFSFTDHVNTEKSSWIKSASYFSCNRLTGYLIIILKNKTYIHQGVPLTIWQSFIRASSYGEFYNNNLKHKYKLELND